MKDLNKLRKKIDKIDKKMASLYEERMEVAKDIALYKKENGLEVFNAAREQEVISKNKENISNPDLKNHYEEFIKEVMKESKDYQKEIIEKK